MRRSKHPGYCALSMNIHCALDPIEKHIHLLISAMSVCRLWPWTASRALADSTSNGFTRDAAVSAAVSAVMASERSNASSSSSAMCLERAEDVRSSLQCRLPWLATIDAQEPTSVIHESALGTTFDPAYVKRWARVRMIICDAKRAYAVTMWWSMMTATASSRSLWLCARVLWSRGQSAGWG